MLNLILFLSLFYNQGFSMDKLSSCPNKPNCVSSQSMSDYAKITPLKMSESIESTKNKIIEIMNKIPRTKLIKNKNLYLHFTTKTLLIRFTDDIEFLIDETNKVVHFKSASRVGHRDFGVNRKRLEGIRSEW